MGSAHRAWLLVAAIGILGFARECPADDLADMIEKAERCVVRINASTSEGRIVGSGFLIGDGIIATNFHVIEGTSSAEAEFSDGEKVKLSGFVAYDQVRDVAIVAHKPVGRGRLLLATVAPRKGERVVAIGAPKGLSFSSSDGIVSAVRTNGELQEMIGAKIGHPDMTWVQTTAAISGGNSGGPLLNLTGEVVGMNTMTRLGGQSLNFAVSAADISTVLDRAKESAPFSKLPRRRSTRETARAGSPAEPSSIIVTLPSGRVLDIDEIFLAPFKSRDISFHADEKSGNYVTSFKHPNGKIAAVVTERRGVFQGPILTTYESGGTSTFANYIDGQLHGNLLTRDEQGQKVMFAQFDKGKEHGLICFYRDGTLLLVEEAKRGKVEATHFFDANVLTKSYGPNDERDEAVQTAVAELDKTKTEMKQRELKAKKTVAEMAKRRSRAIAAAKNAQDLEGVLRQGSRQNAETNAALQALYRSLGGR